MHAPGEAPWPIGAKPAFFVIGFAPICLLFGPSLADLQAHLLEIGPITHRPCDSNHADCYKVRYIQEEMIKLPYGVKE